MLLAKGAYVEDKEKTGYTALQLAALQGHAPTVAALLAGGADPLTQNVFGKVAHDMAIRAVMADPALMHQLKPPKSFYAIRAAAKGDTETVEALHAEGTDVEGRGGTHRGTPLHAASGGGHIGTAEALLAMGAEIEAKDALGANPLHRAAREGHTATVEALLSNGATPDAFEPLGNAAIGDPCQVHDQQDESDW